METLIVNVLLLLGIVVFIAFVIRISQGIMARGIREMPDVVIDSLNQVFLTLYGVLKNILKAFLVTPLELTTRVVAGLLDIPIILIWKVFHLDVLFERPSLIKLLK